MSKFYCGNCHTIVDPKDAFCEGCGNKLPDKESKNERKINGGEF